MCPRAISGSTILSNREDTRPAALAAAIMDRVIGGDFPRAASAGEAALRRLGKAGFTLAQTTMIEGSYVDRETGEWMTLLRSRTACFAGRPSVTHSFSTTRDDGVFRDGDDYRATVPVELRFDFDHGDVVCRLDLGGQAMTLHKSARPIHAPEALAAFVGAYENQEIGSRHLIRVEGRDLVIDYGLGGDGGLAFVMEPDRR